WSADTGELLREVPLGLKGVQRVALSGDAKLLCEVMEKGGVGYRRINAVTGAEELRALPGEGRLKSISQDGNYYAATGEEGPGRYRAGAERALWKQAGIYTHIHVAFSADGQVVVAATWSGVRAWETATGRALGPTAGSRSEELEHSEGVRLAPDARTAAVV